MKPTRFFLFFIMSIGFWGMTQAQNEGVGIKMVDGNQAAGKVLVSDANGQASWQDSKAAIPDTALPVPIRFHGAEIFVHPTENATDVDWTTAQSTCTGLTAFGFSDWYLPSRLELDAMYK